MPRNEGTVNARRALDRLRALQRSPAQLADFALELLVPKQAPEVLQAAATALAEHPHTGAHDAIVARLIELADGRKRDPGGFTRAALVRALQHVVLPEDAPLLEAAAVLREPSMQSPDGPAVLRAAALVALLDLDPALAAYHAAAHLADHDRMSGEPAVTAVRVLAAAGNETVLVATILGGTDHADVRAECLRQLREVPPAVLAQVVAAAKKDGREPVQLGLCDLFVSHRPGPELTAQAAAFLRDTSELELYHYLVATMVAERREDLLAVLRDEVREQRAEAKRRILADGLGVRAGDPAVDVLLAELRRPDPRPGS